MDGSSPTHVSRPTSEEVLAPISKLPDEILLDIFMLAAAMEDFLKGPFLFTHICRYWRALAAGAPLLWVKPRTRNYERVKLMLERSDPAELDVVLESRMPMRTAQAIIDCMERVGSLMLSLYTCEDEQSSAPLAVARVDLLDNDHVIQLMPLLLRELRQRPRCLKALTIHSFPDSDANPLLQLLRPMDQLLQLRLYSTAFEWSIFPLRRLAHMDIRLAIVSSPISIQHLVEILGQMALLESLVFEQLGRILSRPTLPSSASAIPSQSSKITLPLLHYLRLQDNTIDFAFYFLAHTVLPQLRRLAIAIEVDETMFSDNAIFHDSIYTPLMLALTATITAGRFGLFECLKLHVHSFDLETASLNDNDACGPAVLGDGAPSIPSEISIYYGQPFWNDTRIDGRLVGALLMEDLIGLTCTPSLARINRIQIDDNISVVTFEQLLRTPCCLSLESLAIRDPGQYIPALCSLLAVTLLQNIEDAPLIPFPELREIVFYLGRLDDVAPTVWDAFCDCLTLRKRVGSPLQEMCVDESSITSEQISSLENAVTACIRPIHMLDRDS